MLALSQLSYGPISITYASWSLRESNPRPPDCEPGALPTELKPQFSDWFYDELGVWSWTRNRFATWPLVEGRSAVVTRYLFDPIYGQDVLVPGNSALLAVTKLARVRLVDFANDI